MSCPSLLLCGKEYRSLCWNVSRQKTKATDLWFDGGGGGRGIKLKRTRKRKPGLFHFPGHCRSGGSQAPWAARDFGDSSLQRGPSLLAPGLDAAEIITQLIDSVMM